MAGAILPLIVLGAGIAGLALSRKGHAAPVAPSNQGTFEFDPNLPPQYEAQVLGALGTVTDPEQLNTLAAQMDAMGFHLTASALRHRASELQGLHVGPPAPSVPPLGPPPSTPVAPWPAPAPSPGAPPVAPPAGPLPGISGLDATMDPTTRAAVLQALATETDPAKLSGFATAIQGKYPIAAGLLLIKAAAMRAQQAVTPTGPVVPGPTPAPAPTPVSTLPVLDPTQLAPGHSVRALMNADQWYGVLQLLNQWLEDNHADPAISFIDLGFYRDNADDLQDESNFQLAVDALQSHANQKGYSVPPNLPGSTAGVLDGQTLLTLLLYATAHGHAIPPVLVPVGQGLQVALAALLTPPTAAMAAAKPPPATLPLALPHATAAPLALSATAPATAPPGVSWVLATIADVTRDGTQSRFAALLSQPVGYEESGTFNGRLWKFRVVSKATDPNLTTFAKDVKGWIGQPATPTAQPPVVAPGPARPALAIVAPGSVIMPASAPPAPVAAASLADVQRALNALGGPGTPLTVDGINGPRTTAAVRAFQAAHGLTVDGVAGPQTKAMLMQALATPPGVPSIPVAFAPRPAVPPVAAIAPFAITTLGDVQHALNVLGGSGTPLTVDGVNGPKTIAALKAFQSAHGLAVDGVAGPKTKTALAQALAQTASLTGT